MPPPPLLTLLLAALLSVSGCGSDSRVILRPVEVERRECWTLDDDASIPTPPEDGASEAMEAEYEVRLTAALWRMRCACGVRRVDWCNYDGTVRE